MSIDYEKRCKTALQWAESYSQMATTTSTRAWIIDQMVKELTGDDYIGWVARYENDGEREWPVGVDPYF